MKIKKIIILFQVPFFFFAFSTGCISGNAQTRNSGSERFNSSQKINVAGYEVEDRDFSKDRSSNNTKNISEVGFSELKEKKNIHREKITFNESEKDNSKKNNQSFISKKYFQTGTASWYGREFQGKTTASGTKFNMYDFTAAHKTLPFGSIIEVTNFDTGKSVKVKINDRGPYRGNRIIDLSFNAAKKIGMIPKGKASVGIRVLSKGDTENKISIIEDDDIVDNKISPVVEEKTSPEDTFRIEGTGYFQVQAGAFYSKNNAENFKEKLESITGKSVAVVKDGDFFKVRITGLNSRKEAEKIKRTLRNEEIQAFIIKKEE